MDLFNQVLLAELPFYDFPRGVSASGVHPSYKQQRAINRELRRDNLNLNLQIINMESEFETERKQLLEEIKMHRKESQIMKRWAIYIGDQSDATVEDWKEKCGRIMEIVKDMGFHHKRVSRENIRFRDINSGYIAKINQLEADARLHRRVYKHLVDKLNSKG